MTTDPVKLSKFLSFVLRHEPRPIGLTLDPQGWASIDELIEKARAKGTTFNRALLLKSSRITTRSDFPYRKTASAFAPRRVIP